MPDAAARADSSLSSLAETATSESHDTMQTIQGMVILITGASSGIGEATARHLAEAGASVMLGARRAERLDSSSPRSRPLAGRPRRASWT